MRQFWTTALELAGAILIVVGIDLVYFPAGLITAGCFMLAAGYLVADDT